jgi:hypothetical protein
LMVLSPSDILRKMNNLIISTVKFDKILHTINFFVLQYL